MTQFEFSSVQECNGLDISIFVTWTYKPHGEMSGFWTMIMMTGGRVLDFVVVPTLGGHNLAADPSQYRRWKLRKACFDKSRSF